MSVKRPTIEQMTDIVESLGMTMSKERVGEFISLMDGSFAAYDIVDQMPDEIPVVKYPRTPGYRPSAEENPLNAWYVKTDIQGRAERQAQRQDGRRQGQCLRRRRADDERLLDPRRLYAQHRRHDRHASPRRRRDDQGQGALRMFLPFGRQPHRRAWPVHNPHKRGYSAGGSSSGSGALVAAGEVDLAIGGDQGGSIRMPASFCGVYGMKPTHGLVPYTGVMPIESTIDHTGPDHRDRRRQRADAGSSCGADGLDPRQYAPKVGDYSAATKRGAKGLKIGVVKEGFGHANSEKDVDARCARRPSASRRSARRSRRSRSPSTSLRQRSGRRSRSKGCRRR